MSTLRQAAERALKAMEDIEEEVGCLDFSEEITALWLVLAKSEYEQPKQNLELERTLAERGQGPMAWGIFLEHQGKWLLTSRVYESEQSANLNSNGFKTGALLDGLKFDASKIDVRPLYTVPTPRKPLTENDMPTLFVNGLALNSEATAEIVRAVEKAHGIGEQHE